MPEILEVFQTPLTLPALSGLKATDNLRKVQSLAQLPGNQNFLPHQLAAMGSGSQHMVQGSCCFKGSFNGKRFVSQTLNLFNK